MKSLLLLLGIILLFGSLSKPPVLPCSTKMEMKVYYKSRLIRRVILDDGLFWENHHPAISYIGKVSGKSDQCDSLVVSIYTEPVKKSFPANFK